MTTEPSITIVTALIRPHMEEHVVRALHDLLPDFPGFVITEVRGQGRGRGVGGAYEANELELTYHRYLQLQLVCPSNVAEQIRDTVAKAAWTGHKGDGVIFTNAAESFARIRLVGKPNDAVSS